jgi:endonuclease G
MDKGDKWYFLHDATTLGGNSGSPVIDMTTGFAAGLHFQGEFKQANYAVSVKELATVLNNLKQTFTPGHVVDAVPTAPTSMEEAPAEDLSGRKGYDAKFLGGKAVALPKVLIDDIVTLDDDDEGVLKYTHFSVVMCQSRRLCWFSAVNINGKSSISIKGNRPPWKFDSRIPKKFQIKDECYGLERNGKFSRGHMTRREDPNWGSQQEAATANRDTFNVTNCVPQMQPFNAGVWLGLEDYALQNARQDDMKISVFTGPVFKDDDPEFHGVKVPVQNWKIIVFVHDRTKKLCATGYLMSQRDFLPGEEFVFGRHETYQTPISQIESMTNLSFGDISKLDPLTGPQPESVTAARPLQELEDIVFHLE